MINMMVKSILEFQLLCGVYSWIYTLHRSVSIRCFRMFFYLFWRHFLKEPLPEINCSFRIWLPSECQVQSGRHLSCQDDQLRIGPLMACLVLLIRPFLLALPLNFYPRSFLQLNLAILATLPTNSIPTLPRSQNRYFPKTKFLQMREDVKEGELMEKMRIRKILSRDSFNKQPSYFDNYPSQDAIKHLKMENVFLCNIYIGLPYVSV